MKKLLIAMAALAAATATIAASAGARPAGDTASCYPGHEFTTFNWTGAFNATSTGMAAGNGGDVSWSLSLSVTGNKPNAGPFAANPGTLDGSLDAWIHVPQVQHAVHFTSHCISTAELGPDTIDVTFEGVSDLPWWDGDHSTYVELFLAGCVRPKVQPSPSVLCERAAPAVASTPLRRVDFYVTHGLTCAFNDPPTDFRFTDLHPSGSYKGTFKGKGNNTLRGRAGLPDGFTAQNNPCDGLFYG